MLPFLVQFMIWSWLNVIFSHVHTNWSYWSLCNMTPRVSPPNIDLNIVHNIEKTTYPYKFFYISFCTVSSSSLAIVRLLLYSEPDSPHLGSPNNVFMLVSFTILPFSESTQKHIVPRHWTFSNLPSCWHRGISWSGRGLLEFSWYWCWHSVKRAPAIKCWCKIITFLWAVVMHEYDD